MAVLAIFLVWEFMMWESAQGYTYTNTVAVINDTTNEIVWVGGGGLCIPAAANTHLVFDCGKASGLPGYDCNGTYYNMSRIQISCGGIVTNNST